MIPSSRDKWRWGDLSGSREVRGGVGKQSWRLGLSLLVVVSCRTGTLLAAPTQALPPLVLPKASSWLLLSSMNAHGTNLHLSKCFCSNLINNTEVMSKS